MILFDEIRKSLEQFVKEIYIVILGVGFAYFASGFLDQLFNKGIFNWSQLVYFCSLYYFLSYDWIAYNSLICRFPYKILSGSLSFGRFYSDLFALVLKTGLIFLSTQTVSVLHLISAATLFLGWHGTILVWFYFAKRDDYEILPKIWNSHIFMIGIYLLYASSLLFLQRFTNIFTCETTLFVFLLILCVIIVGHARWRKKFLIKGLEEKK